MDGDDGFHGCRNLWKVEGCVGVKGVWRGGGNGEQGAVKVGGPQEKMSFFQIASVPILSIPFHLKTCQYDPCKVPLKKMTPSLPMNPPKAAFFCISDWTSD
jgi:hypothetical protein